DGLRQENKRKQEETRGRRPLQIEHQLRRGRLHGWTTTRGTRGNKRKREETRGRRPLQIEHQLRRGR
ncbi:hypothetical protein Pmani_031918, partial [Petrolisthes manimaculis]